MGTSQSLIGHGVHLESVRMIQLVVQVVKTSHWLLKDLGDPQRVSPLNFSLSYRTPADGGRHTHGTGVFIFGVSACGLSWVTETETHYTLFSQLDVL